MVNTPTQCLSYKPSTPSKPIVKSFLKKERLKNLSFLLPFFLHYVNLLSSSRAIVRNITGQNSETKHKMQEHDDDNRL
jgi:hypothetical protein